MEDNEVDVSAEPTAEVTETVPYMGQLEDIHTEIQFTNHLLGGFCFFFGILFGCILIKILTDHLR